MQRLTDDAGPNAEILLNLMQLARQTGTDAEGVVSWLAASYDPEQALDMLVR